MLNGRCSPVNDGRKSDFFGGVSNVVGKGKAGRKGKGVLYIQVWGARPTSGKRFLDGSFKGLSRRGSIKGDSLEFPLGREGQKREASPYLKKGAVLQIF